MRISDIAFANLKRRKGKAIFLAVGIGTVVALTSLSGSIRKGNGAQLEQFGANIVVVSRSDSMSVNYGGVAMVHQLTHIHDGQMQHPLRCDQPLSEHPTAPRCGTPQLYSTT